MPETTPELGFEQALEKLQLTVKRLESGELSLDDALKGFEEGVRLTRVCQKQLSDAEARVEQLMGVSVAGIPQTAPFGAGK